MVIKSHIYKDSDNRGLFIEEKDGVRFERFKRDGYSKDSGGSPGL
jgi:hypothetical protein